MNDLARPFPAFLRPWFDPHELDESPSVIAAVDLEGAILWTNPSWTRFALENGVAPERAFWSSYFDAISPPLRDHYRSVFANALATGEAFAQVYECSSPTEFRLFHMRLMPIKRDGFLVEHSLALRALHDRDAVEATEAEYQDDDGFLVQCSNCRRMKHPKSRSWDWVPSLLAGSTRLVSHGICASCMGFYWGDLDAV